jgi:hypothetical protein
MEGLAVSDTIKAAGAIIVSAITGVIAIWWLYEVSTRLGLPPATDASGNVIDEFQRAKDILIVVLPMFSASIAFWVGSSGTAAAKKEAADSRQQLDAVIDASSEGVLQKAREMHPSAFGQ